MFVDVLCDYMRVCTSYCTFDTLFNNRYTIIITFVIILRTLDHRQLLDSPARKPKKNEVTNTMTLGILL